MKPRIRKVANLWRCEGHGHIAIGNTPAAAYEGWGNGLRGIAQYQTPGMRGQQSYNFQGAAFEQYLC